MWEICFSSEKKWLPATDWIDVERALEHLDNADHAYFNLCEDGIRYMKVYGGNQNRVVVEFLNVRLNPPHQYQILNDPKQTTLVRINQWDGWDLPPEICVDKALAKQALKYFYEMQEPLETLMWGRWPLLWELQINKDREPLKTWEQIEQAIDQMDNSEYAYVALGFENDTERAMEVYGGNQGRVYLTYTNQDGAFESILVDWTQTQSLHLFNGLHQNQFDNLPPHHCVDKTLAKQALKHFFATQKLDQDLVWDDGSWPSLLLSVNQTRKVVRQWAEVEQAIDQMDNKAYA